MHLKSNSIVSTPWVQSNIKLSTFFKNTSECCLIAKCYKETLRASNMVRGSSPEQREVSCILLPLNIDICSCLCNQTQITFWSKWVKVYLHYKIVFLRFCFLICYWNNVINVFHGKSNLNLITFNQAEIIILNYGVWNKTHEASSFGEGDRRTPIVSFPFSSGYIKVTGYPKWAFVLDLLTGRCTDDIRGFPHFVL